MPTGYTADVGDGKVTDFRTFALRCSRAFGATIMQRDNPTDELPEHRREGAYYAESLREAEEEAARFDAMTLDEAALAMAAEIVAEEERIAKHRAACDVKRVRYEAMLEQVRAWDAPTADHRGLRDLMEKQLLDSIDFDCTFDERYWRDERPSSVADWLALRMVTAHGRVEQRRKEQQEERARCETANAWIDALYASLDRPEAVPLADRSEP